MSRKDPPRGAEQSAEHGVERGVNRAPDRRSGDAGTADPPQPPLRVTVYHGDLRSVGLPVIVGSNDGTPIRGAERAVDEFLDGAVSRRAALRRLHGAAGTCELFTARGGAGARGGGDRAGQPR